MGLEPATGWWKEEFLGEEPMYAEPLTGDRKGVFRSRGCVVGAWCMGWLRENKVREEVRMIIKSLGGHDEEIGFISDPLGGS